MLSDSKHRGTPASWHSGIRLAVKAAIGIGTVGSLLAAQAAMAAAPANASDDLQEVIVTAQFRQQNLQDTPLAITAVSAALLESRNQTNLTELTNQAPNVTLKQQGQAFGPAMGASIRGIGQYDFNPALEPGVGIYIDDVYFATLTGSLFDLLDLDRVEILRGPQGTLAGRNSIGGAVKLYSAKPKGDDKGSISLTYGSRNREEIRASGDFAISDTLFARVAGVSKRQDGYIERRDYGCVYPNNAFGIKPLLSTTKGCVVSKDSNVDYTGLRAALRWIPTDDLEFNFAVDYTHDSRNPTGAVLVTGTTTPQNENVQAIQDASTANNASMSAFVVPAGSYYNYASFYSPPGTYRWPLTGTPTAVIPLVETRPTTPRQFYDGWGASLDVDWTLAEKTKLRSISAYRQYKSGFINDNDLSPLGQSLGWGTLPFHSFSQELRLNGEFLTRFQYTLGGFYMNTYSRYESWQDLRYTANNPLQFNQNDPVLADSKAAFGQLGYNATDALTFTGGIRYTKESKDYTFVRLNRDGTPNPYLLSLNNKALQPPPYSGSKVDWRLAAQYRWNDQIMTYAQVATGFKGGGVSPRPFVIEQARPFNPEELRSYEIGIKSDLFDRKLRVNADVFFGKYKDIQLGLITCPQFSGTSGVAQCGTIANAGNADVKGAELEATWRPIGGLAIDASYSYLDFSYSYLNPDVGGPTRAAGCPSACTFLQSWMRPPYMPKSKWSAGIQYDFLMGDKGMFVPRVDVSHTGTQFASSTNRPNNQIDAYTVVNARLTWKDSNGKWESSAEVTNLTDKYYFLTRSDSPTLGYSDGQPARPREWALTVKRKF
jgi:iron complex outermembrane receptor protein